MVRATIPAAAGVAAGAVLATLASGVFPAGFVRRLEPDPGWRVDLTVFAGGGALLLGGLLAWVGGATLASRPGTRRASLSVTSETIARGAPTPAAAIGARFALTGPDGSSRPARGTLVGLALTVAGLLGAAAFAESLDRLVSDGDRFGTNYDFAIGDLADMSASELRAALEDDPDIAGLMVLSIGQARSGTTTVGLAGVERVHGDLAPRLLAGRLPAGPDEIAMGRVTARQLDLAVGDELQLVGADDRSVYRVVGLAVIPGGGGLDGVGLGGIVTPDGLRALDPVPDTTMAAFVLRPDASEGAIERINALLDGGSGTMDRPSAILNLARVRRIPGILAGLLGALAVVTMAHAVIVSIYSRRRDLAVLRALGADRRWISRAVHWQATVLIGLPILVGVPLGLVAGSVVFRSFADRVGAVPDPVLPFMLIMVAMLCLVALANLSAVVPARRARRLSTADQLQDE